MKQKCFYCKQDLEKRKPKFIFTIKELSLVGYTNYQFCSHLCLVKWFMKKFKQTIKRAGY